MAKLCGYFTWNSRLRQLTPLQVVQSFLDFRGKRVANPNVGSGDFCHQGDAASSEVMEVNGLIYPLMLLLHISGERDLHPDGDSVIFRSLFRMLNYGSVD